jgi:hypothetical protein
MESFSEFNLSWISLEWFPYPQLQHCCPMVAVLRLCRLGKDADIGLIVWFTCMDDPEDLALGDDGIGICSDCMQLRQSPGPAQLLSDFGDKVTMCR